MVVKIYVARYCVTCTVSISVFQRSLRRILGSLGLSVLDSTFHKLGWNEKLRRSETGNTYDQSWLYTIKINTDFCCICKYYTLVKNHIVVEIGVSYSFFLKLDFFLGR